MQDKFIKQVQEKIKKLGLKPSESVIAQKKENQLYYRTDALDNEKKKIFFKASLSNDAQTIKSLANEVYILKRISALKNGHHALLPNIIKSRVGKNFVWHTREFIEGENFGNWQTGFSPEIMKNLSLAKKLSLGIYYLQIHLLSTTDDKQLNSRKIEAVIKEIKNLSRNLLESKIITQVQIEKIEKKVSNIKIQESFVFCHGNLEPKNILHNKGNAGLINWQDSIISNPAMDLASIWIYAIENEKWQKCFIESYLEFSSNQTIVEQYLEIEKIYQILNILNRFNKESQIKTIKNGKKRFFNKLKKSLNTLI